MHRLQLLHRAMIAANTKRHAFDYQDGRARVRAVFCVDDHPYELLIAAQGVTTYAFCVEVTDRYWVANYFGDHYGPLKEALGITGNPHSDRPWGPTAFFGRMNDHIPTSVPANPPAPPVDLIRLCRPDVEEAEKIYFMDWRDNEKRGEHVSAENLAKTRLWLGYEVYDRCRRSNISSMWTADPTRGRPVTPPPDKLPGTSK